MNATLFPNGTLDSTVASLITQQRLRFNPFTVNCGLRVDHFLKAPLPPEQDRIEGVLICTVEGRYQSLGEIKYFISTAIYEEFDFATYYDPPPSNTNPSSRTLHDVHPQIVLAIKEALCEYPRYAYGSKARQLYAIANKNVVGK